MSDCGDAICDGGAEGDAICDDGGDCAEGDYGFDDPQETGSNMGSELEKDARSFFGGVQSHRRRHRHRCRMPKNSIHFHEPDHFHARPQCQRCSQFHDEHHQ